MLDPASFNKLAGPKNSSNHLSSGFTRDKKGTREPNSFDLASLVQQETCKRTVVQTFLNLDVSTSAPDQSMNHCSLACLLLNRFARFGSTCNLLVSCETPREVVQIFIDPARFNKRAGSTNYCSTCFKNLGRRMVQRLVGSTYWLRAMWFKTHH